MFTKESISNIIGEFDCLDDFFNDRNLSYGDILIFPKEKVTNTQLRELSKIKPVVYSIYILLDNNQWEVL